MSRFRSFPVVSLPSFLALLPFVAFADTVPGVYPTPHHAKLSGGLLTLASSAKITGEATADRDAVKLLRARLALGAATGDIREIVIGKAGDAAVKGFDDGVPKKSGAYRLVAAAGRIVIVGADDRGVFYGVQTLRQLLDADANPADLPAVTVDDAPDIGFRGVVEGFYGTPWSHADRLSQFVFYGRHKMDTYIYGPKDDPFHSSPNWRKPYPAPEAARIRELCRVAKENKVDFVWAIHPGKDIKWTPADYEAVKSKFKAMYSLGVRSFAVFFDDIGGEGTNPEKQADLLNWLNREFVKPAGDVTPLVMCPTEYNKSWSNPKPGTYLDILGEKLDPSIHVMWTGDTVVADIHKNSLTWVNARLRRSAYIWWNFPVTDYARNHLVMGPVYGNDKDIAPMMSGFVSNPMERAEASKVALYGVAGYAWNVAEFDSASAWEGALREVLPKAPDAFRVFCSHNQDLGPNGHGYRRVESTEIAPAAKTFLAAFRDGRTDVASAGILRSEFSRITAAPAAIRAAGKDNPALIEQIGPWLDAFEQLGLAGVAAVDLAGAPDKNAAWASYASAAGALEKKAAISSSSNRNPYQAGVSTGSLVLEPLVVEILKTSSSKILEATSGRPVPVVRPVTNSESTDTLDRMVDGDPATYYYSQKVQKVGDWFGVDFGTVIPVTKVRLLMGRKDGDHDIVHRGRLETSVDGKTWSPLGPETSGEAVAWDGAPVQARQVRYRVTTAGKVDGSKPDVWCAIRTFDVNGLQLQTVGASSPKIKTSVENLRKVPVRFEADAFAIAPQLEVFTLPAGGEIGVEFPRGLALKTFEIDLSASGASTWAKVEVSSDGKAWRTVKATSKGATGLTGDVAGEVRFLRIRNGGKSPVDAKLAVFRVVPAAGDAASPFTDGLLETSGVLVAKTAIAVPADAKGVTLLFAKGSGAGVRVGAASMKDGSAQALGKSAGDLAEFAIPAGTKFLVIEPAAPGAKLHEAVWRR